MILAFYLLTVSILLYRIRYTTTECELLAARAEHERRAMEDGCDAHHRLQRVNQILGQNGAPAVIEVLGNRVLLTWKGQVEEVDP